MKYGVRKPNLKKSIKARTTGKVKRQVKKAVNPLYGKKGMGIVNDPKKAAYNAVYNRTTVGVSDIAKGLTAANGNPAASSSSNAPQKKEYSPNTYSVCGILMIVLGVFLALIGILLLFAVPVEIKLDHLQNVVDNSGKNTPTLKTLKIMWGLMYDYAVVHEIVSQDKRDMVRYVDISKAGNPNAYNRKPFSKKEISILWKCKDSNVYVTVILIMIYSGVRIGELLDLEKKDIHLDERWFYVKESKTEAGIREVPIAEKVVPFFEYWMNRKCDHLICTPDDEPFQYRNYYDSYWIPLMLEFGFGKFIIDETKKEPVYDGHRPHDTRHTCISLLTEKKVDERFIKKIVGHKGQGVTENVYTHIELPTKLEAINLI